MSLIDTDFERNVKRVQPFIGLLLVFSVGLLVYMVVHRSANDLAASLASGTAIGVSGTITLANDRDLQYGDLANFRTTISGEEQDEAHGYVIVVCFQEEELVYQYSAKRGVKFLLTDPLEPGFEWDGGAASCTASLIYRVPVGNSAELYMLESTSFEVLAR